MRRELDANSMVNAMTMSIGGMHSHHPQRAILIWDTTGNKNNESSLTHDKKRVTFAFVPYLKTDEQVIEFSDKVIKPN